MILVGCHYFGRDEQKSFDFEGGGREQEIEPFGEEFLF